MFLNLQWVKVHRVRICAKPDLRAPSTLLPPARNKWRPYRIKIVTLLCCLLGASALSAKSATPKYAENFSLEPKDGYQLLSIRNGALSENSVKQYALVPRGQPETKIPDNTTLIHTPVTRVVVMETVYIGYLEALDALDAIIAAGTADFISQKTIRARVENGEIARVQVGQSLDIEKLLLLQPDLILTSVSGDPRFDVPASLARTGLPVLLTAGYLEANPLARAEWIKCLAALFGKEAEADRIFDAVDRRYQTLKALTADEAVRPTVFSGAPYSGAWYVPAGESYMAKAIRDAGGDYLWSDVPKTGAIPLDTERVFLKAANADFWINPSHYQTLSSLFAADPRFAKFSAAGKGSVFNNTRQVGSGGGNAIWERGVVHPDQVLADLIKIFHPELLPDHAFVYYEAIR
jgi:iron complex transport system substrate-binding protein